MRRSILHNIAIVSVLLFSVVTSAQPTKTDKVIDLEEVVVSGQIEPQSVKKSVKNVQVITKEQIKGVGATHLGEVLNQYVNLNILPDEGSGKQKISLYGLGANYFKVFVDNVPLVSEDGLGVNTDLSQINVDDIERIEIVEGAMGVTHGANAVTGIMNIITKKKATNKWDITYSLQEETLSREYNFLNKGKHYLNFRAATNLSKRWFASVGMNRNNFNGFWGKYKGKNYLGTDGLRGFERQPYFLYQTNVMTTYQGDSYKFIYRFEYMRDQYNTYDRTAERTYSPRYGDYTFGNDQRDYYSRQNHQLNLSGSLSQLKYNLTASYQYQERATETFRYLIDYHHEINNEKRRNQSMDVFYSSGYLSGALAKKRYQWQVGYEAVRNQGYAIIRDEGSTEKFVDKAIDNYDLYASVEANITKKFSIRPGARYSIQRLFNNQYAYSLGARYLLPANVELRASVGQAYRTPSFQELYVRNVFIGHIFLGNENLVPERSFSTEFNAKKVFTFGTDAATQLTSNLAFSHNRIYDKIDNILLELQGGMPHTQYLNVSRFLNNNIITTHRFVWNNLGLTLGGAFVWVSQTDDVSKIKKDDRFLLNINANAGLAYQLSKTNTVLTANYKFVGKSQMWMATADGAALGTLSPYGWVDASVQQSFWQKRIDFVLGCRNVLNVINTTLTQTSLLGITTERNYPIANGRMFYLKLSYNLNIKY